MKNNNKKRRWLRILTSYLLILVMVIGSVTSPIFASRAYASPVDDILNEVLDKVGMREAAEALSAFVGDGDMEALQKAFQSVTGGDVAGSAQDSTQDISKILEILQDLAATGDIGMTILRAVPFTFGVETDLPDIRLDSSNVLKARAWADKYENGAVAAAIRLDGPDGSQAVLGIGNDNPLGRGNAQHFANTNNTPSAFLDISRDGKSYVHLRVPLLFGSSSFSAVDYIPVPYLNDKFIQVKIGAMEDAKVNLEFEFSLKGTIDATITADAETTATLSFEVSQSNADKLLKQMTSYLAKTTLAVTSKYTDSNGNIVRTPTPQEATDDAVRILKNAMDWLYGYSQREKDVLGEISLGVGLNGSVGLGVADTVWPAASANAGMSVSIPVGGLVSISDTTLKTFIEFGPYMSQDLQKTVSRMLIGTPLNISDFSALNTMWVSNGKPFLNSIISAAGEEEVGMELNASLSLAGKGGKNEAVELMAVSASIPASTAIQNDFIGQTMQAVAATLGGLLSGSSMSYIIPKNVTPILAKDGIADSVLEDTTIGLSTSVVPLVQLTAEFPAKPYLRALVDSGDLINAKLDEAVNRTSLKPIEEMMNGLKETAPQAFEGLRNSTFGLSLGGGTSADLGAEAVISVSAGINVSAWTNTEMLLFLTGLDAADIDGNAGMKATVSAGVGGGLSLGEGVEVGAKGTMTVNQNLLNFEFNEVSESPPKLYWTYDSSNTYLVELNAVPPTLGAPFEMTPSYKPTVTDYNVWLPYQRAGQVFYLKLAKAHPGQAIAVQEDNKNKQDYDPNTSYYISGTGVDKQIKIFVTSGNKRAIREYTLHVRMEHSDRLERLLVMEDQGDDGKVDIMDDSFDPYVTAYSLNVGEHTQYVDIKMDKEDVNGAKLTVDGSEWDSAKPYRMDLKHGNNAVNITLSAEDAREPGAAIERTYRVAVYRALSSNANLSYFTLSKGGGENGESPIELDLSADAFNNDFEVNANVRSLEFRFSTVEKDSKVWINDEFIEPSSHDGETGSSYAEAAHLRMGKINKFFIEVKAPNGVAQNYFWVNINRPVPDWSDNPGIISLEPAGQHTISTPVEGVYRVNFPINNPAGERVQVTVQTERVKSFQLLGQPGGFQVKSREENTLWDIYTNNYSGYEAIIPFEVTTDSGIKAVYLLVINGKDDKMRWPGLTMTDEDGQLLQLIPKDKNKRYISGFDKNVTEYILTVPESTQAVTVNGRSEFDSAWVTVNGELSQIPNANPAQNILSPVRVPLDQGMNRIEMTVGAPNGSNKTYTVFVKREYQPERNPEAKSITLSAPDTFGSKSLDTAQLSHNVDVDYRTKNLTITVTPKTQATSVLKFNTGGSGEQTINGNTGTFPLQLGENVITVETTAADGILKQVYTITLNRLPSSDATLGLLKVGGESVTGLDGLWTFSKVFPNSAESFTLEAAPSVMPGDGPGASLTLNGTPYDIGSAREIPLEVGGNDIKILVTAEDSRTTRVYSIFALRSGPPDTTPPNLALQDITVEASSSQGAYVTYWPMAMDETDGRVSVISTPHPGSLFGLGENTVTAWAEDHSGNRATGTFKVTVQDTTPPVITVPADIIVPVDETGKSGTAYFDGISAYDAVDGAVEVTTTFKSGTKFPLGSTKVTSIAEDSRGNIAYKTFTVLVTDDLGVASASPAKNQLNVSPDSVISLTFNNSVQLTPVAQDIIVKENGSVKESTIILSQDGKTLTILPVGGLNYGHSYTVILPEGAAVNAGNADKFSLPYTLSFRTAEAPPVTAETDAAGRTVILTFGKAMADTAGKQGQFKAYINGQERGFTNAAQGENKKQILLTLEGSGLADSDNVAISYAPGDVTTAEGGILGAFSGRAVVNKTTFAGGSGTEADPYLIRNSVQLDAVRNDLHAHYRMIANINLGGYLDKYADYAGWQPIGDSNAPFTGSFNGGGYTIDGLRIERLVNDYIGLFGFISDGVVKNVTLKNVYIKGRNYVGALAGFDSGTVTRTDIHAEGFINGKWNVGGLFGSSSVGVSRTSFEGRVLGQKNVGGVAGELMNSGISESYAKAEVQAESSAGGLVGLLFGLEQKAEVSNSYAFGKIVSRNSETVGTVGFGGLVGYIAGDFKGSIKNSYAIENLIVPSLPSPLRAGVVGNAEDAGITVEDSFYSRDAQDISDNIHYGVPLATSQMKDTTVFANAGWDFTNVWAIGAGTYPYLKHQGYSDFAPPAITAFSPANGASDVPVDSTLTITFDEPVHYYKANDGSYQAMTDPASIVNLIIGGTKVPFIATLSADKKIITVTPTSDLKGFGIYSLIVAGAADAYYNEMAETGITFQTGKPFVEEIIVKTNSETPSVNSISYLWAEVVPGTAGIGMSFTWSVEPGTGEATIDQSGWLSSTKAGTVTVRATANDGSGMSGSMVIDIKERPAIQSVTIDPSEIPEGTAADVKVTVVTEHVDNGTEVTARLVDLSERTQPTAQASGIVMDNHAELTLSVTDMVYGNYDIYTELNSLRLYDYEDFRVQKVNQLATPVITGISAGRDLYWNAVANAVCYEVDITQVSPTGGPTKTVTVQAEPGLGNYRLDLSDPELGLSVTENVYDPSVTESVYNPVYSITVTAKAAPDDKLHTDSLPSIPIEYAIGLDRINIEGVPDGYEEYTYYVGDSFRMTGLVVRAYYTDGHSEILDDLTEDKIVGFDSSKSGDLDLTVTYGGKTAPTSFFARVVEPHLVGVFITTPPSKRIYYLGESIDLTGMVVKAVYENGAEKELSFGDLTIKGFDTSNVSINKDIQVSYGGIFDYFDIEVHFYTGAALGTTSTTFDVNAPADIEIPITWNQSTRITEVFHGATYYVDGKPYNSEELFLQEGRDYTISTKEDGGDVVTINKALFYGAEEDEFHGFYFSFDKGMFESLEVLTTDSSKTHNDASLSSLKTGVDNYSSDKMPVPGFAPDRYRYVVQVPEGTQPGDEAAYLYVRPTDMFAEWETTQVEEIPGSATVIVTSRDGTVKQNYTVTFVYQGTVLSNDATLEGLMVDEVPIAGFDPSVYSYVVKLPSDTKPGDAAALITAAAAHPEAFVKVTQADEFPGSTTVEVLAEDAMTKLTYTVNFVLPGIALSSDASLDWLMVGGVPVAGFNPNGYSYAVQLPPGTKPGSAETLVTAVAAHPEAVVKTTQAHEIPGSATVEVTAEDGTEIQTYLVNFTTSAVHSVGLSANPSTDGAVFGSGTYIKGATVTVTAAAKKGYSFINWTEDGVQVSTNAVYTFIMGKADRNLKANFASVPTYSVAFDSQGGSAVEGISDVISGSTISEPVAPERSGYTFGGWYKEADCINAWNFTTDKVTGNLTLYAKWTQSGGNGDGNDDSNPTSEHQHTSQVLESITPKLDSSTGIAVVEVDSASLDRAFDMSETGDNGVTTVVIDTPKIEDADAYEFVLPAEFITVGDVTKAIEMKTDIASVTVPGNMLASSDAAGAQNVSLIIADGDKSKLDADTQAQIGDRPVVELTLKVDGEPISWSNDSAPVTVSVPYTPTAEELKDPEHITVWYIDGNGKVVAVPNGRYNPATGQVTFTTTHFSQYAVVYIHKHFYDLDGVAWAKKPIEVMASKGIISGTGKDTYSPAANITRADYLVLLVKTLGLTAKFDDNFDDVERGTYYYDAVGIAKKLGITKGSENNRFNPKENISRQDMMVLTARALEKYKGLKAADNSSVLDRFSDKEYIAEYAVNSLITLVNEGLIEGSGNKLNPQAYTSRAEAAVFLYKIYNKYPR